MHLSFRTSTWLLTGLLIVGLIVVRMDQINSQPVNFADTNDLLLAVNSQSLAHPPGYPHLIWLLVGLHALLPSLPLVLLANGFSLVCMSVSAGLLFLLLLGGIRRWIDPQFSAYEYPLGLVLIWSATPLYWTLTSVIEVMPLGLLLSLLFLLAVVLNRRFWIGFWGMMAGLYHPILFGLVMWVWALSGWDRWKRRQTFGLELKGVVTALLMTMVLYGTLAWGSHTYEWELPQVWWQWIWWWTRAVYTKEGSAIEQFNHGLQWGPMWDALWRWGAWWFLEQRGWVFMGLTAIGLWVVWRKKQWKTLVWLGVPIIGFGPLLAVYIKHPASFQLAETAVWWGQALRERMFYVLPLAWVPLATIGLLKWKSRLSYWILLIGCISVWGWQDNWAGVTNGVTISSLYTNTLLKTLPDQAVVLVDSDEVFQLLFAQQLLHIRQDVMIVPTGMILEPIKWRQQENQLSRYGFSEDTKRFVADVIHTSLINHRRVYLYSMDPEILRYLGLEGNPYYAMPYGWMLEVSQQPIGQLLPFDYGVSVQLASIKTKQADAWFKGFRTHLAVIHTQQVYYLARMGLQEQALWHAQVANDLFYLSSSHDIVTATINQAKQTYEMQGNFAMYVPQPVFAWEQKAAAAQQTSAWDKAAYFLSRALLLDPSREDLRAQLILAYSKLGAWDEAAAEQLLLR